MTVIATIVIIVIVVGFVVFVFNAMKGAGENVERSLTADASVPKRPMPIVTEFHVRGNTAHTVFAVPLGDAAAGQHLIELLSAAAVEYVRDKSMGGLPLDDVHRIEVSAMRDGTPEVLGTVDLPDPGVLPDRADSVLSEPLHDPIAVVHGVIADASVASQSATGISLEPVAQAVELSGPTDSHLDRLASIRQRWNLVTSSLDSSGLAATTSMSAEQESQDSQVCVMEPPTCTTSRGTESRRFS